MATKHATTELIRAVRGDFLEVVNQIETMVRKPVTIRGTIFITLIQLGIAYLGVHLMQETTVSVQRDIGLVKESILSLPFVPHTEEVLKESSDYSPQVPIAAKARSVEEYVKRFYKVAQGEQRKFGIPASISLAQGIVESRFGTSKLAIQNNNHFGIKCFSKKCSDGHCTNHKDDHRKDFFRKFPTAWESWRAHSLVIKSTRYTRHLKTYGRDYQGWAKALKRGGYATDDDYAEKLVSVIKEYKLYKYDL